MEYVPPVPGFAPTLPNLIADVSTRFADNEFLVDGALRLTYAQAERSAAQVARGLLALGVGKAARVAIVLPDKADWVIAWWAAARIGALTIPLSTLYQARELAWALQQADVDTVIIAHGFLGVDYLERLEQAVPGLAQQASPQLFLKSQPYLRRVIVWGECDRPWAIQGAKALDAIAQEHAAIDDAYLREVESRIEPSDLLIGICTSGSSSVPKIVLHTHASMIRATYAVRESFLGLIRAEDRCYSGMPMFWVGGLNVNLMPATYAGACVVFAPSPKATDVLDVIVSEHITRVAMWPTQYKPLMDLAAARGVDLHHITMVNRPQDRAVPTVPPERRIVSLLGMTETFGPHGFGNWDEDLGEANGGSFGRQVQGIERRIVDPLTHAELPRGQEGELQVRGFPMMEGYYKRERSEVFLPDGWFATGDICAINADGCLFFRGRMGDMIKTLGANVSPQEVEAVMMTCPGVAEAVVVGVPDADAGERVVAVVVARQGESVDGETLRKRLLGEMSAYKVPREILVMAHEQIPRTGAAKVQRNALKALLEQRGR